jgi:hypothetical protein
MRPLSPLYVVPTASGRRDQLERIPGLVVVRKNQNKFLKQISDGPTWSEELIWEQRTIEQIFNEILSPQAKPVGVNQIADRITSLFSDQVFSLNGALVPDRKYVIGYTSPKPLLVYLFYSATAQEWAMGEIECVNLSPVRDRFLFAQPVSMLIENK